MLITNYKCNKICNWCDGDGTASISHCFAHSFMQTPFFTLRKYLSEFFSIENKVGVKKKLVLQLLLIRISFLGNFEFKYFRVIIISRTAFVLDLFICV